MAESQGQGFHGVWQAAAGEWSTKPDEGAHSVHFLSFHLKVNHTLLNLNFFGQNHWRKLVFWKTGPKMLESVWAKNKFTW